MVKIGIIAGSSRPGRFNIQPANWITDLAKDRDDIEVELLDLAEINLPFLDEPNTPLSHDYTKDHTKAWSEKIEGIDGFVMVTPEYNHSFSPLLKNALDYLYYEWNFKPVTFVSYGSIAGGSRAVEHLRGVCGELKLFDLREQIMFPSYWNHMDEGGAYQFTEEDTKAASTMLDSVAFWATELKESRSKEVPNRK